MRTRLSLETEARRLEEQAKVATQTSLVVNQQAGVVPPSLPLFRFPESTVAINAASEFEGPLIHRMVRSISALKTEQGLEYSLIEEEFVSTEEGELVRHYDPIDLVTSDDPFEVLSAGYQRLDEDTLRERIGGIVDRIEANTFAEPATAQDVAEVESLTSDIVLSVAARMRVKVDAVDLLEGRLEPGDFVARTVARQDYLQKGERLGQSQQITESIDL